MCVAARSVQHSQMIITKHQCQATCHSQMLGPHSCSTRHHPIGHSYSITGVFYPYSFRMPVRSQGGPLFTFDFSPHCEVKGKAGKVPHTLLALHVSNGSSHLAHAPDPILDSSLLRIDCPGNRLRQVPQRRRFHLPDLAGFHSMIP